MGQLLATRGSGQEEDEDEDAAPCAPQSHQLSHQHLPKKSRSHRRTRGDATSPVTARDRRPGGDIPLTLGGWQNHSPQLGRITGLLCKVWFLIPADASAVSARRRADATAGPPAARKDAELNYGCGSPAAGRGRLCLPGATSPRLKSRLHSPFHVNPEKRNEPGCLTHRKAPEELAWCPWLKKGRGCAVRYPASGSSHKRGAQLSVLRAPVCP